MSSKLKPSHLKQHQSFACNFAIWGNFFSAPHVNWQKWLYWGRRTHFLGDFHMPDKLVLTVGLGLRSPPVWASPLGPEGKEMETASPLEG